MNFIKKVFDGMIDDLVHLQFQKFSKGEFKNKAIILAKNSGGKYTISTSSEFANELVRISAENLGSEKTIVKGAIISTSNLDGEIKFKEKKQFQGVKKYIIDSEMSGDEILSLLNKFPSVFFALSFKISEMEIKIKPKIPKSSKAKNKEENVKPDFCKLITKNKMVAHDFVFEVQDFKHAEIKHTFFIDAIIVPDELKTSNDFAKIRENARRKGRVLREVVIDGREMGNEKEFEA